MARGMSPKQGRAYDRVLKSERDRGAGTRQGKAIAERSEAKREPADYRGGRRPHLGGPTYRQLYAEAQRRGLKGRSRMTKAQLERAVGRG